MHILNVKNDFELSTAMLAASFEDAEEAQLGDRLPGQLTTAVAAISEVVADFDREESRARAHMNATGYAHAMAETRARIAERLERITAPLISALQARVAGLQSRLVPTPADARDKVALMIEIRQLLRQRDPMDVVSIYLEAARTRDAITLAACETAPTWAPLISPDVRAAGQRIVAELDHPDVIHALGKTESVLNALESAIRACKRHCGLIDSPAALAGPDA